ncbi:hypothetical protein U9890_14530 [Escherichia coli]
MTALSAEFTIGEGELMAHDVPLGCAPDEYDDLISGTCSHLPLWIWATLYRPERGWGMQNHDSSVVQLQQRIAGLEKQLADIKSSSAE